MCVLDGRISVSSMVSNLKSDKLEVKISVCLKHSKLEIDIFAKQLLDDDEFFIELIHKFNALVS